MLALFCKMRLWVGSADPSLLQSEWSWRNIFIASAAALGLFRQIDVAAWTALFNFSPPSSLRSRGLTLA